MDWWMLLGSFLGGFISRRFGYDEWYWGAFWGPVGGCIALVLRLGWRALKMA